MPLATLAELKAYLDIQSTNATRDSVLDMLLAAASDRVTALADVRFAPDPAWVGSPLADTASPVVKTVYLSPFASRVPIPHARAITEVKLDGQVSTDYRAVPWREVSGVGPVYRRLVLTAPATKVEITGRFGVWPVPADVKDAVLAWAARRWKEREASFGDSVQLPDGGSLSYFKVMPPFVRATIADWREPGL